MILERIVDFLATQRVASLSEIASVVGSSPDAVRSMMQTLQRKGLAHRFRPQSGCGSGCRQCVEGTLEVYGYGAEPASSIDVVHCEGLDTRR